MAVLTLIDGRLRVENGALVLSETANDPCCCGCICSCTDLLFLIDTTGSMGGQLNAFRAAMNTVVDKFNSPTCRWGVANYKDFEDGGPYANGWRVNTNFTNNVGAAQNAINGLFHSGGGDELEQNLAALSNAANQWQSIGGRAPTDACGNNSSVTIKRAVVWAGDVGGWENGAKGLPYPSLAATIAALVAAQIKVIALGGGLGPQATAITAATGGIFLSNSGTDSAQILDAICLALVGQPYEED